MAQYQNVRLVDLGLSAPDHGRLDLGRVRLLIVVIVAAADNGVAGAGCRDRGRCAGSRETADAGSAAEAATNAVLSRRIVCFMASDANALAEA
jgi:hypothetical protein